MLMVVKGFVWTVNKILNYKSLQEIFGLNIGFYGKERILVLIWLKQIFFLMRYIDVMTILLMAHNYFNL